MNRKTQLLLLLALSVFLSACFPMFSESTDQPSEEIIEITWYEPLVTEIPFTPETQELTEGISTAQETPIPTPTSKPDPFSRFYGCEMEMKVLTGPLETQTSQFTILGEDYFVEKGDKFDLGKGTGVFYEEQRYLILHSSYINSNALRPMEAEFLRLFFERWGNHGPEYIKSQIEALIGSEVLWICDGKSVFKTQINGVSRLSYEASNRLWLRPEELEDLLLDREGEPSEWVGEITVTDDVTLYLGFCGWGPASLGSERYTYYRYLIQFEVIS